MAELAPFPEDSSSKQLAPPSSLIQAYCQARERPLGQPGAWALGSSCVSGAAVGRDPRGALTPHVL